MTFRPPTTYDHIRYLIEDYALDPTRDYSCIECHLIDAEHTDECEYGKVLAFIESEAKK